MPPGSSVSRWKPYRRSAIKPTWSSSARRCKNSPVRKVLFNLHLYAGLAAAVFILIFGITGSVMAFEPEIDHLLHPHLSYVKPRGRARSLAELSAVIAQRYPGERISIYS